MRRLVFCLLWLGVLPAQAQYPYGYYAPAPPPYPYRYPGNVRPYVAPPQSAPTAPPASLAHEMLAAQNAVRARVGVPPLAWSPRVAAVAQEWADRLIRSNAFAHRPDNAYGENLYAISGGAATPAEVVEAWADEARDYHLRSNSCDSECGHYTQLVWRATRYLGCGVATDPEREVWVCDYDPPGNYVGYRPY